jgi:G3E family GTPase
MFKRETTPFRFEIAANSILPDRDGAGDRMSVSRFTSFVGSGMRMVLMSKSGDVQSWLGAQTRTSLDCRHPPGMVGQNRGNKPAEQDPDFRHAGIHRRKVKAFYHDLEHPVTADDLCTWLELLMDFAGSDLLRLKAIVGVAGRPGPVLLHAVRRLLYPPMTLSQWPSEDRRTRIVLVTRNLNENCLRELLGILTAAGSAHARSKVPSIKPALDRMAG